MQTSVPLFQKHGIIYHLGRIYSVPVRPGAHLDQWFLCTQSLSSVVPTLCSDSNNHPDLDLFPCSHFLPLHPFILFTFPHLSECLSPPRRVPACSVPSLSKGSRSRRCPCPQDLPAIHPVSELSLLIVRPFTADGHISYLSKPGVFRAMSKLESPVLSTSYLVGNFS